MEIEIINLKEENVDIKELFKDCQPLVASVVNTNTAFMALFSKEMTGYSSHGSYNRFIDNYSYEINRQRVS